MSRLSAAEALALLRGSQPITFDDLDDIFCAFGFSSDLRFGGVVWYYHADYPGCGDFRAEPRYEYSILSDEQRHLVLTMIACVQMRRGA